MDKKYWYVIIGVVVVLAFFLIRSCQPTRSPAETPQVPTLAPASPATSTPKPQITNTPVKPTTAPTTVASATAKPKPTNTSPAQPNPTATTAPTQDPIQLVNWEWISLKFKTTGEIKLNPDPKYYTIIFYPDGSISGKADCNTFKGNYSTNIDFKINVTGTTRMACEAGSMETEYLALLAEIVAGGPDGSGGFALETAGGEKRMEFQNGGSAK